MAMPLESDSAEETPWNSIPRRPCPRPRGMMDFLIEFCVSLEGAEAFASAGVNARDLRDRLIIIQSWLDDPPPSHSTPPSYRHQFSKVKDLAYDLENLFEDIELEFMAASPSSDPVWSALLSIQHWTHQRCSLRGIAPIPSTADRLASMMKFIDHLLDEIKLPFVSHSIPPPPREIIVQKPMVWNWNRNGLKELIDEGGSGTSFPHHGCLLRYNDCSRHVSSLKGRVPQYCVPFKELELFLDAYDQDFPYPWYLKQCVDFWKFTSTFPYGPKKATLILLWVAEGFVQQAHGRSLEDEACDYYDGLLRRRAIAKEFSGYQILPDGFFEFMNKHGDHRGHPPKYERHVSIPNFYKSDMETITNLTNSSACRTLFLFSNNYNHSNSRSDDRYYDQFQLPAVLFLKLTNLRVLILSGVGFWSVPAYIFGLFHLRYLDLSDNPLKELCDSLVNLFRLQTLKVVRTYIKSLPKNFYRMTSLRHIYVDFWVCSGSVPRFIGKLFSLQTFENFAVDKQHGCKISELKDLNNLHGKLCIDQLENVTSFDEALQARLYLKRHLTWLRLCWSKLGMRDGNCAVLEFLQPHYNLKALEIYRYENSRFPNWMSDPSFQKLESVTLEDCICEQLPAFGQLPCLKSLTISQVRGVKHICKKFYGRGKVKVGFPSLCTLYISFMPDLETWFGFSNGDLPKLEKLSIAWCPELKRLPEMKTLNSLTKLVIEECTKLNSLPKKGLPGNVNSLRIHYCPGLSEKCDKEVGAEWKKIAHIPSMDLWI